MNRTHVRAAAAVCILATVACGLPGFALAAGTGTDVWAITGIRIVPVSGPAVEKGAVVIRDGLIENVGAAVAVPPDARILDGTGMTVYPGLVDAFSFVEDEQKDQQAGRPQQPVLPERDKPAGFTPGRDAIDLVKPGGRAESLRAAGITASLAVPKGGIVRGRSALVASGGNTPAAMSIRQPVALHIAFEPAGGFGAFPNSTMGAIAVVRQALVDAERHRKSWERYAGAPAGVRRPEPNASFDDLAPALAMPVVLEANGAPEILRVLRLADEFKLDPIVAGGAEAWRVADRLKTRNVPVLLTLNFPEPPTDVDPETRETLRAVRARVDAPANAAKLHAAGVRFAFQGNGLKSPSKFRDNAIRAVKAGLPKDAALAAMTLVPAQMLGVGRQLGSIEPGKIANLLVTDGDLFDEKTKIKFVFVDGVRFEMKAEAAPVAGGEAAAVDVTGTWTVQVMTPEGTQTVTLALTQSGPAVTGTLTHPILGASDVRSGVVSGKKVTFSVTLNSGGTSIEANLSGTVDGNSMSGTVTVGGQESVEFTATRPNAL